MAKEEEGDQQDSLDSSIFDPLYRLLERRRIFCSHELPTWLVAVNVPTSN